MYHSWWLSRKDRRVARRPTMGGLSRDSYCNNTNVHPFRERIWLAVTSVLCTTDAPLLLCRRTCKLCTIWNLVSPGNERRSSYCSSSDVHERRPRLSTQIRSMELHIQRPVWRTNVYSARQNQTWPCWNHTESRWSGQVNVVFDNEEDDEMRWPLVEEEGLHRRRLEADDRVKVKGELKQHTRPFKVVLLS